MFGRIKYFFFSAITFYFRLLIALVTKGFRDSPTEENPLSDNEFYYSTNRIYTKDKVKKVYFITELPRTVDRGFLKHLRDIVEEESDYVRSTYGLEERCELVVYMKNSPYILDFNSFKSRSRIHMWKSRYERAIREHGDRTSLDNLIDKEGIAATVDRNRWMIESWLYIKRMKEEIRGSFSSTNIVLELVADNDDLLEKGENKLKDYLIGNGISYKEIFLQTNEYLKAFSPVGNVNNNLLAKMNKPVILTDEVLVGMDEPTHGKVGEELGQCFGVDIYSCLPIYFDLKKGNDAINFLIAAGTGGGKSNYVKGLATYLDLTDINTIILDVEGDEYTSWGKIYDAKFIKVSGDDSGYFNTIAIGDLTGDEKIDVNLKNEAISVTERVFSLLLDEKNGMTPYELSIFSDCVNRLYEKFGVTEDRETWKNSKGCTYFLLYGELVEMSKIDFYVREYGDHIKDMIIKLRTYFEIDGINSSMFKNPINIEDLLGSKHVIFSFGLKGVDESLINSKELALKQLSVGYITNLIANYNKSRGKLTGIFIEELQRYLNHEHSSSIVANIISGGRKRGMITFLITNAPLQLFGSRSDKKTERDKHEDAILGNMNGYIFGKLKKEEYEGLCTYFALEEVIPHMKLISEDNSMKYSFFVKYKDEQTIVKQMFDRGLLETSLYKTRDDQLS